MKTWYARPGDQFEVPVKGEASDGRRYRYHIDILRTSDASSSTHETGGQLLIEIQTRSFSSLKRKLYTLTEPHHTHHVHLVYPISVERWLIDLEGDGSLIKRRKSPKRGRVEDAFKELVHLPDLIHRPQFSFEVLLIHDEEVRIDDGKGSWRRKRRSIHDRRLLAVVGSRVFETAADFCTLLPPGLSKPFTVSELASLSQLNRALAGKMAYCLWKMGAIERIGKQSNAYLYARTGII